MEINYADLNEKHIRSVDKMYRMFAGLASRIISYKSRTIELGIFISKRWPKNATTTAIQLSKCWRQYNDCLKDAQFYKVTLVYLNSDQDTGGIVSPLPSLNIPSLTQALWEVVQKMNNPGENISIILTGDIDDESSN